MKRFDITSKPLIAALAVMLMLGLGACTTKKREYVEQPVETLYNAAMIASAGYLHLVDGRTADLTLNADPSARL